MRRLKISELDEGGIYQCILSGKLVFIGKIEIDHKIPMAVGIYYARGEYREANYLDGMLVARPVKNIVDVRIDEDQFKSKIQPLGENYLT